MMIQKFITMFTLFLTMNVQIGNSQKETAKDLTVSLPEDNWVALLFIVQNRNVKGVSMAIDQSIINNLVAQLNKQLPQPAQDSTTKPKK